MSRSDFGYSSLNSNLNSSKTSKDNNLSSTNSARVISIVLDETHPKFNILGGWKALGAIEYDLVNEPSYSNNYPVAYPLDSNIKIFPLINEIVLIQSAFDSGANLFEEGLKIISGVTKKYYTSKIGVWNHPHHNAASFKIYNPPPPQNKTYDQTQIGNVSVISNESTKIYLGKTFKEKANIHPLLPFEGDVINEGRWGNSIRLGSTVKNTSNNWSKTGQDGDPLIIIRNGQGNQTEEGWIPIIENINNNESSVYLTSTQNIPLKASSINYTSYTNPPTTPDQFSGPQIILDSGRLVFNSYIDHILLSSAKSINLNSQESVNIDTKKFITQADKIFLGKEDLATEPLLLGDTTAQLLRDLTSSVKELTNTLQTLTSAPVAPFTPATFPTLLVPTTKILTILNSLEKQLGTSKENCTITSKHNFTL